MQNNAKNPVISGLKIYNTLTRKMEHFSPIDTQMVKMYACGITVYDEAHIWHARQAIIFDIIRKYLIYLWYNVKYVRNYTDIDDKIINRANENNRDSKELSDYFVEQTKLDLDLLKVASADAEPKVTDNIPEIISFIEWLIDKWFAYVTEWDVFFEVRKFGDYGRLSNRNVNDMIVQESNDRKKNPEDFSLWKEAKPFEPYWNSPWWKWRPGWHIECSVLVYKYLWEQIDIHGGWMDILFPHHENEIAQSEAYTWKKFSKYWIHNWLVNVEWQKMWKSLWNFVTIKESLKEYSPDTIRFAILSSNITSPIDFNKDLFRVANKRVYYFYKTLEIVDSIISKNEITEDKNLLPSLFDNYENIFQDSMNDNFNFSKVVADISDIFTRINVFLDTKSIIDSDKTSTLMLFKEKLKIATNILGIIDEDPKKYIMNFKNRYLESLNIPESMISEYINKRIKAKEIKDYTSADSIRNELKEKWIILRDIGNETIWEVQI